MNSELTSKETSLETQNLKSMFSKLLTGALVILMVGITAFAALCAAMLFI